MCGISGVVDKSKKKIKEPEIKNMNNLISHRGPDDEGFFYGENFAFGHRRLSILDLSSDGHQPMHYLNKKYTITYNGEVYNYLEIRKELENNGYAFNSETDTEVILASYDMWGEKCVNKFNGMWAFALYDRDKNIIFCSRDRFGIKPFYYTEVDGKFVFGSEIKQLLEFYDENIANTNILVDYLLYGLEEHTNETFFKNIYKLEQSHNLVYNLHINTFEINKYYEIEIDDKLDKLSEQESILEIKAKLESSIELRLRSDVKVGTCLSGGLDSSSIAAIAAKNYFEQTGKRFTAIHAKSIEEKTDESHFAKEVEIHCNLNMITVEPQLEDITLYIEEVVYTQEEPFGGPSIFMQYFVMKEARAQGCIVMLDGQGGDETLFGYETYYSVYFSSLLKQLKIFQYVKDMTRLETFKVTKKRIVRDSIINLIRNNLSFIEQKIRKRKIFIKGDIDRNRLNPIFKFLEFEDFQKRELMLRNLPHLLRYEDKNSMRNSVETRLPFVDYKFVQSAISVNNSFKFKDGYLKYVLRKIVEDILPKSIVWRKNKFGFEAPTDMWIESHKNNMIEEINNSDILKNLMEVDKNQFKNKSILWKMYNIAIWEKVYKVQYDK